MRIKYILVALMISMSVLALTLLPGYSAIAKNSASSSYEITKYSRYVSGHKWRYVLVDRNATKRDLQNIYDELRAKYPNDYFELFNDKDTLVAMYMHSRKKAKFPDTKGHLGMINQMGYDDEWRFTTMSGYKLLEE